MPISRIRAPTMVCFCGNGPKFGLLSQIGQNFTLKVRIPSFNSQTTLKCKSKIHPDVCFSLFYKQITDGQSVEMYGHKAAALLHFTILLLAKVIIKLPLGLLNWCD